MENASSSGLLSAASWWLRGWPCLRGDKSSWSWSKIDPGPCCRATDVLVTERSDSRFNRGLWLARRSELRPLIGQPAAFYCLSLSWTIFSRTWLLTVETEWVWVACSAVSCGQECEADRCHSSGERSAPGLLLAGCKLSSLWLVTAYLWCMQQCRRAN